MKSMDKDFKEAIDAYNRTAESFMHNGEDCEYKRGFVDGFCEGSKNEKRRFMNYICSNCENHDDEQRCKKYDFCKSFDRENNCQKIKDTFMELFCGVDTSDGNDSMVLRVWDKCLGKDILTLNDGEIPPFLEKIEDNC